MSNQYPNVNNQYQNPNQGQYQGINPMQYNNMNPGSYSPNTNKIYVVSKADAEQRLAPMNSYGVYFDQNHPVLYEVYTSWDGKKATKTYSITEINECNDNEADIKVQFAQFKEEILGMIKNIRGNNDGN